MDVFTQIIESIEGTEFYQKYMVNFPEPLNNVAFDLVLILVIVGITVVPSVIGAIKSRSVKKRIRQKAEEYKAQIKAEKEKAEQEKQEEKAARKEEIEMRKEEMNALKQFAKNETKKAAVAEGSVRPFRISTRSMEPALLMNTTVYAKPVMASDVKEGDVIAYRYDTKRGSVYVIHRIVGMNEDGTYRLKGDNEEKEDPPVKAEQIEYLVVND
ncbi:MAG: S24/S26 family peptidase [Lachnospiraceae bacterium]|nr:S24/S26 family peptidase [Lachnospiraceae bacterium]